MYNYQILSTALSQYDIKEIIGKGDNPDVLKYFDVTGFDGSALKDETAWCSAFMNWVAITVGVEHSGKLNARSWLNVGWPNSNPEPGDIVVLWRESPTSWKGHVGVYVSKNDKHVYILGGNQNNKVCIKPYPINRVLAYRTLGIKSNT